MQDAIDLLYHFRWAVMGSVLAGVLCSLAGGVLLLRRMVLLGIALPQAAAAGICLVFLAAQQVKLRSLAPGDVPFLSHEAMDVLAPVGSIGGVLAMLFLLAWLERRALLLEAQWGTVYVASAAVSILALTINPYGEAHMQALLQGQVLTVTFTQFCMIAVITAAVGLCMLLFRREFLLVSFDPDMAQSLRLNVKGWRVLLYLILGVTISVGVMILGPLFTFGYLLLLYIPLFPLVIFGLVRDSFFSNFFSDYFQPWPSYNHGLSQILDILILFIMIIGLVTTGILLLSPFFLFESLWQSFRRSHLRLINRVDQRPASRQQGEGEAQ